MLDLIRSVSTEYGIDVILSSHVLAEVERVCDNVVIIGDGQTLAWGSLEEISGAGERGVDVEFDTTPDVVASIAAALPDDFHVTVDHRRLVIVGDEQRIAEHLRTLCHDKAIGLIRYGPRRRSLEDIYLEQAT